MNTWFVVVSIVLFLHLEESWAVGNNASVKCIEKERLSLLSLKQGFVDHNNDLSSWGSGESQKECCNWEGVYCDNLTGHVVRLILSTYGLQGTLSPSLAELHLLRTLDLGYNNFTLSPFPSFVTSLKELQFLDLSSNNLKGEIPQELGDLSSLEILLLGSNQLEGGIPKSFALLCNLRHLDLYKNSLSGQIDDLVASFSRNCGDNNTLQFLDLSQNQFSGSLPSFSQLSSLESLNLSRNQLNGTLNDSIGLLSNLQVLDLYFNHLKGEIPQELGDLSSLQTLVLSFNQLEGGIPKSFALLCNLRHLDLYTNSLSGQIDDFVASFSRNCGDNNTLQFLDLSQNQFSGSLPSFSQLSSLETLNLGSNKLNGTLNDSIGLLSNLQVLDLYFNNLEGEIPQELGDLSSLQTLELSFNQLEGDIPKSLALLCNLRRLRLNKNSLSGQIDDFVASFSRNCGDNNTLQTLYLSNNQFSGPLPSFSQLSSLEVLYLGHNQLNGTLNDSIGLLSNLKELGMEHNSLEGVISESHLLRLSKISFLDFSFNRFVFQVSPDWVPPFQSSRIFLASCKLGPSFPMWVQTQKSCSDLDISSAGIFGTIPSWFWNLPFEKLNISHNQFTGEIPDLLSFTYRYLDSSSNLFEGSIPSTLSHITLTLYLSNNMFTDASSLLCPNMNTSLYVLDLSNNQLFGTLPDCWSRFQSLVVLNVANNSFSGKIPASMGSLRNLQVLHLGYNRFTGEIPMFLNKCTELTTFDIVHNNFLGTIPSWIGSELQKLRVLIFRSNLFSGSLPSTICDLSQVQILDLSMNNITGSLPKCLNQLSALANRTNFDASIIYHLPLAFYVVGFDYGRVVDIASLIWKGRESRYQNTLGLVKSIDFSHNMLIGEIPSELMDLVGLVSLNISRNMISGQIPTAIGQLNSLDFLDLSRNHLFGRIPSQLSQIDRLSVMDLSYNNLSGEIPIGTQLQSFDPSTYVGNEGLCGDPLPKCPKPKKPTVDNKDDEPFFSQGFYISLSLGFSAGFWGVCSLIFLNKSWRNAYFKLINDAYDKVYVVVAINKAKLRRWWNNRAST